MNRQGGTAPEAGSAVERHTINELIPFGFGPANLGDAG